MENKRMLHMAGLLKEVEVKFKIELPKEIKILHDAFKNAGKKLYVVGGSVRDAVLGKQPKDFDVATNATPNEVMNLLDGAGIKSFPKGESFGVVSAVINGQEFEIATFREESYHGGEGRRPTSVTYSDISGDVKRRDLTINALYYDIDEEKIIDLVGGLEDIKNKKVKAVGNVMDRLEEDRLRSLRILRFAHRFDSPIDEETRKAILHFKDLPGVSNERIRDEFIRGLMTAIKPEKYLDDYRMLGLFPRVLQGASIDSDFVAGLNDPILVMAKMLRHNRSDVVSRALTKFTATLEEKENVKFLLAILERFGEFDRINFIPEIDGKWLMGLYKLRNVQNKNISDSQIEEWAKITGINSHIIKSFLEFEPKYAASNFPEIAPSKELGDAISKANAEQFINEL
jgi:tRNA nucleotidyltransferase/poly(A) polymerase